MYKIIGIDEAGKGPVLGSMFVGFAITNLNSKSDFENFEKSLENIGVCDSKKLTPKKRAEIFLEVKKKLNYRFIKLTPQIIDANFFSGGKLNDLEIRSIVKVLEEEKPDLIIIDALTANPKSFGKKILSNLTFSPEIISENKADIKFKLVGAASIIAKENREEEIKGIKSRFDINCGSGYPADPNTKKFLYENYKNEEFKEIFRTSWKTYSNLIKKETQRNLSDF